MASLYTTVSVFEANPAKFSIGPDPRPKKNGTNAILYDGKIPTLTFDDGKTGKDKFTLFSYKGVEKKRVWNASMKQFTNEWDGTYNISFTLTRNFSEASEPEKKIIELFDAIKKRTEEFIKEIYSDDDAKCEMIYNPTFEKKESRNGQVIKTKNIDKNGGIYLSMKCSYTAPKDAPKIKNKSGGEEPALEYRTMATPFYSPKSGLATPDDVIGKSIKCIPEAMLQYSYVNDKHYLTLRVQKCYYVPAPSLQQGPSASILMQMANLSTDHQQYEVEE